eukprot:1231957-Rhodomonas_salina.2
MMIIAAIMMMLRLTTTTSVIYTSKMVSAAHVLIHLEPHFRMGWVYRRLEGGQFCRSLQSAHTRHLDYGACAAFPPGHEQHLTSCPADTCDGRHHCVQLALS